MGMRVTLLRTRPPICVSISESNLKFSRPLQSSGKGLFYLLLMGLSR